MKLAEMIFVHAEAGKNIKDAVKRKHHHRYQRILGWKKTAFILSFLAQLPPLNN